MNIIRAEKCRITIDCKRPFKYRIHCKLPKDWQPKQWRPEHTAALLTPGTMDVTIEKLMKSRTFSGSIRPLSEKELQELAEDLGIVQAIGGEDDRGKQTNFQDDRNESEA